MARHLYRMNDPSSARMCHFAKPQAEFEEDRECATKSKVEVSNITHTIIYLHLITVQQHSL